MSKMSTDLTRHALNGATMGTRWSALLYADAAFDPAPLQIALQAAVDQVDAQMSTWRPDSDLMRLNAAPLNAWVQVPPALMAVLATALQVGRATGGAFEIAMGDAIAAWGFGPAQADSDHIRSARLKPRRPSFDSLELDVAHGLARKHDTSTFDLSGIAKGYGVDRLAETLLAHGVPQGLVAIDGEVRALGCQPDGTAWPVAVEAPDRHARAVHSMLALHDGAVATSGDYRHWVQVGRRLLSHTIDPRTGAPLLNAPASVTVLAQSCMLADAYATALMVMGPDAGKAFATQNHLNALFLIRDGADIRSLGAGPLFDPTCDSDPACLCRPA